MITDQELDILAKLCGFNNESGDAKERLRTFGRNCEAKGFMRGQAANDQLVRVYEAQVDRVNAMQTPAASGSATDPLAEAQRAVAVLHDEHDINRKLVRKHIKRLRKMAKTLELRLW